jgi:hypothetical protein
VTTDEELQIWEAKIANYHTSGQTAEEWCAATESVLINSSTGSNS